VITFCALLYVKRLNDKPYDLKAMRDHSKITPNNPQEPSAVENKQKQMKRKQIIQNKWFLYYTLVNNHTLIIYRKKEFSYNRLVGLDCQRN
jgi:hypothetical protein